ncbi:MAG TPA: cupin domain-containing protein, partial [Acidimicrobiia bacterium]|nr:cupin domain-containing protein [Acidimicrobiia bacterium]
LDDTTGRQALEGHPGITAHRFVSGPDQGTRWLLVTLNLIAPGGGIDPHYHEGLTADHAYFLIDGRAIARIGDEEHEVNPNGLMVFRSDVVHGFRIVGTEPARVLRLGAAPDGIATGGSVFLDEGRSGA